MDKSRQLCLLPACYNQHILGEIPCCDMKRELLDGVTQLHHGLASSTAQQPDASQHSGALRPDRHPAERSAGCSTTYWFSLQVTATPQEGKSKQQQNRTNIEFWPNNSNTLFQTFGTSIDLLNKNDGGHSVTRFRIKKKKITINLFFFKVGAIELLRWLAMKNLLEIGEEEKDENQNHCAINVYF